MKRRIHIHMHPRSIPPPRRIFHSPPQQDFLRFFTCRSQEKTAIISLSSFKLFLELNSKRYVRILFWEKYKLESPFIDPIDVPGTKDIYSDGLSMFQARTEKNRIFGSNSLRRGGIHWLYSLHSSIASYFALTNCSFVGCHTRVQVLRKSFEKDEYLCLIWGFKLVRF